MATKTPKSDAIDYAGGGPTLPEGLTEVPVKEPVGEYPPRPYGEAVTDEHRAVLEAAGVHVDSKTVSEQDAVAATS